ncbi:uncharacterized protein LOC144145456 [Haemaphysalis longicornis]
MRIKGLERLELRGAHGLILRPFSKETVAAVIMENRLRVLSLTTAQGISQYLMELIGLLSRLEELALGNCTNWPAAFFTSIGKLKNLRRLALEGGEDGKGFSTMLLGLSRLERLELKRWTLSDSLCDVLPRMENLRTFLIWPRSTGPVALTNRNALRSCLIARNKMERLTWIVDYQHLVDRGSPTRGKSLALALKQLAPDVHIAIEPGRLCRCTPGVATAFFRRTPSAATSSALVALHNLCNATEPSNIQDNTARNSRVSDSCASSATNRTSCRASTSATPAPLSSQMCDGVVGVNMGKSVAPSLVQPLDRSNTVLSSGNAPHQTTSSSKAASKSSAAAGACCAIAETLLGVWDISLEEKWHLTLQQLCEGLGHCMGPATSVSVGLRVEP